MFGCHLKASGNSQRRGFTLIELAIVLAVTSLLAAGLWRMMATGNSQLRDQAAADQMKDLMGAVRGYLSSTQGTTWISTFAPGAAALGLPGDAGACAGDQASFCANFLPANFTNATANSYGQTYNINVAAETDVATGAVTSYSFMIKTNTAVGEIIPDTSGGRISSMIGNDGGFIYTANVCGAAGATACGAYGTWQSTPAAAPPAGYSMGGVGGGQIAARTFVGMNASLNTPWLARVDIPGDVVTDSIGDFNRIQTPIALGGNFFYGGIGASDVGGIIDNLNEINIFAPTDTTALTVNKSACVKASPTDATCAEAVSITGAVNITGLLSATQLYAMQFIYNSSDERLKHDIKPIEKPLDKFAQINGYSFVLNRGDEKKYGVIAQEVEKVFPEIVVNSAEGYKTVDYMGLIGPLVAAVKELKLENDKLRSILDKQAQDITMLSKKAGKKTK